MGFWDGKKVLITGHTGFKGAWISELLMSRHGVQHIVFSGVPPMGHFPLLPQPLRWVLGQQAARLDQSMAEFATSSADTSHLPLDMPIEPDMAAEDGYHPSELAYAFWAERLGEHIAEVWR